MKTQEKMKAKARRQTNRQLVAREQYRKGHWIRLLPTLSMPHYNLPFELTEVEKPQKPHIHFPAPSRNRFALAAKQIKCLMRACLRPVAWETGISRVEDKNSRSIVEQGLYLSQVAALPER